MRTTMVSLCARCRGSSSRRMATAYPVFATTFTRRRLLRSCVRSCSCHVGPTVRFEREVKHEHAKTAHVQPARSQPRARRLWWAAGHCPDSGCSQQQQPRAERLCRGTRHMIHPTREDSPDALRTAGSLARSTSLDASWSSSLGGTDALSGQRDPLRPCQKLLEDAR